MSDAGFGDYSWSPPVAINIGFGDSFSTGVGRQTGFGDPFDNALTPMAVDVDVIGNDGGARLAIFGAFLPNVEYEVSLSRNSVEYPCFGGVSSSVGVFYQRGRLTCYAPKLEQGIYDLVVSGQTLSNAIRVVPRNKAREVYSLKRLTPSFFKVGARESSADHAQDFSVMESLIMAVGQSLQEFHGKPLTNLTSEWVWSDSVISVETTLGFPQSGLISVGGHILSYGNKTDTTFSTITPVKVTDDLIRKGVEVILYDL